MTEQKQDNVIYVGSKKPLKNYVTAILWQASQTGDFVVKARGRAISHAIDAIEVCRNKWKAISVVDVELGTETIPEKTDAGTEVKTAVSYIEIFAKKA